MGIDLNVSAYVEAVWAWQPPDPWPQQRRATAPLVSVPAPRPAVPLPVPPAYSEDEFAKAMARLLPTGRVWRWDDDSVLQETLRALAPTYVRSSAAAAQLLVDVDPSTTFNLLEEWEASLGLPDPCTPLGATIAQRQAAVRAKFAARGTLTKQYFIDLAGQLGIDITITEYSPSHFGFLFGMPFGGAEWANVWQVTAPAVTGFWFTAGGNVAGDPLRWYDNTEFICRIRQDAPAGTLVLFSFS